MIYIILGFSFLLASYHYDYLDNKRGKFLLFGIYIIILICLAGFRYHLGIDSIRYEGKFSYQEPLNELTKDATDESRFGIGWLLLASFSKTISHEFFILQIIQSLYVNLIIGYFIKKNCKHPFLALFIYFIFLYSDFMVEIMREACAVSTFLFAWKYFKKKKWINYYFCCLLAFCFHISAIVTFLVPLAQVYGIKKIFKINLKLALVLSLVLVAGLYLSIKLFDFFATLSLIESVQERATTYAELDNQSGVRGASILGFISLGLNKVIYPAVAFIYYKKNQGPKKSNLQPLEIMIIFYMLFSVVSFSILIFQRFTNYFAPFIIMLISNSTYTKMHLRKIKYKLSFNLWMVILFPFFFIQLYGYFKEDGQSGVARYKRYEPYSSIIFKTQDKEREKLQRHFVDF